MTYWSSTATRSPRFAFRRLREVSLTPAASTELYTPGRHANTVIGVEQLMKKRVFVLTLGEVGDIDVLTEIANELRLSMFRLTKSDRG